MVSHLFGGGTPTGELVLILIVMDNGLSRLSSLLRLRMIVVLILIVMDNGLSLAVLELKDEPAKKS